MKHLKKLATSSLAGITLLTGVNFATAQVVVTRQNPTYLTGSDTFNRTMDQILTALKASGDVSPNGSGGIDVYSGVGSSAGERQMEGSPGTGEDTCAPNDGNNLPENNPGCQEIAPMSRPMDSSICEDDNAAANAEGIAACQDGIVIIAKNVNYAQYGQGAAACTAYNTASSTSANTSNNPPAASPGFSAYDGVGDWRDSGTIDVAPAGAGPEDYTVSATLGWKDVARIVYTGFDNNDGNGTAAQGGEQNRLTRCNSPLRQAVLSQWSNIAEGSTCSSAGCTNVVRALRRDDASGTTQFFVEALGLTPVLTGQRTNLISLGACTAPVTNFTFCDGGDAEVNFPTNDPGIAGADCSGVRGDPIKKACCENEDICDRNGQMGVVVAVRSPLENLAQSFPVNQCSRNQFARINYQASSHPVCPDGTVPVAGRCRFPFYNNAGVQDFNCINSRNSQPPQLPGGSVDGRVYNSVVRTSAGVVLSSVGNLPESGNYRYNAMDVSTGIVQGGPRPAVCTQGDATSIIGCAVSNTNCCIIGFAGREAAALPGTATVPIDDGNEPFRLNGQNPSNSAIQTGAYPFWRYLYINALNGFENVEQDCLLAGHDADYCADELAIAEEWHDVNNYVPGGSIYNACIAGGVIPLEYNPAQPTSTGPFCVGTQTSSGCGEADDQGCGSNRACSLDQCIPQ